MKRIMAVYDVDPFYADRFAEYANQKEKTPFTAVAFTSMSRLRAFAEQQPVEILLVGDEVEKDEMEGIKARQIIRLSESGAVQPDGSLSVYKYQASDSVLREVMACYQVQTDTELFSGSRVKSKVIGVYSPVSRCGKTSFCLTFGQVIGRQEKVLLLSLETHSGYSRLMRMEYKSSLSDLIYYFRRGEYSRLHLSSVVHSYNGLDYIPPAAYAEDLENLTGTDLAALTARIAEDSGYDTIMIDLGHFDRGAEAVLELCSVVYVPVRDDSISQAKLEEWRSYLEVSRRESIWERVKFLRIPRESMGVSTENYLEQQLWGEMGDYARKLAAGMQG